MGIHRPKGLRASRMTSWMRMMRQRSRARTIMTSTWKPKGLSNSSDRLRLQLSRQASTSKIVPSWRKGDSKAVVCEVSLDGPYQLGIEHEVMIRTICVTQSRVHNKREVTIQMAVWPVLVHNKRSPSPWVWDIWKQHSGINYIYKKTVWEWI